MKNVQRIMGLAAMIGILALLAGCGSSVTRDNFDKIKDGMTVAEVEAILGKPTSTGAGSGAAISVNASGQVSTWQDGERSITITFVNGKVALRASKGL